MPAASPPAVRVEDVHKRFLLPADQTHTLKERALHPFRRSRHERLQALNGVTFDVAPGEFFGIVGRNGSGKSTLLKCMAGIYAVDDGRIYVNGRLSTFIELGVGFNPDLPARDNVLINATMLGLTPREARRRFDEVIAFAELEDFVEVKLKNYSSGMLVRLAFAVMIQVDADVLLIDEVLAVGDASFQQKCFDEFARLREEGRTVVLVTHDMAAVDRFCDRAVLLEHGRMVKIGDPQQVGMEYLQINFSREQQAHDPDEGERYGDRNAEIVEAWFEDEDGLRDQPLQQGRPCTFRARIRFNGEAEHPAVAVLFENDRRNALMAISSEEAEELSGHFAPGEEATFTVSFTNPFQPGRLFASPWIVYRGGRAVMDRRPKMLSTVVTATHDTGALIHIPRQVSLERGAPDREGSALA